MTFGNRKFVGTLGAATLIIVAEYALVLVDSIVAGRVLGEMALGAVALLVPAISLASFFSWLLASGTNAVCQDALGGLRHDEAARLAGQGLLAALALGVFLAAAFFFGLDPYIFFLSPDTATAVFAKDYARWYPLALFLGAVDMYALYLAYFNGAERMCVVSCFAQTLVNIVFSYGLCDGRWGFPALGLPGISLGTVFAYVAGLAVLAPHFLRHPSAFRFRLPFRTAEFAKSLRLGFADANTSLFHAVFLLILAKYLTFFYGADALPVLAVVFGVIRLTGFFTGVGATLQPLETLYYGEGNALGVRRIFNFASLVTLAECAFLTGVLFFAPEIVVSFFGIDDPELFASSVHAVQVTVVGLAGYALTYLLHAHYQGVGHPGHSIAITVLAFLCVPTALLFIFGSYFGMNGICLSIAAGPLVSLAAFLPIFRSRNGDDQTCMWTASVSDRSAPAAIGSAVAKVLEGRCNASSVQRLTDVLLLAFKHLNESNRSASLRTSVHVEVSLLFGTDSAELILRDDGVTCPLENLGLPVVHYAANGLNRNVFTFPIGTKASRFLSARAAGQRYQVLHGRDISLEDMEEVIELDRISLDASYQVQAEQDRALFQSNRENGIIVRETKTGRIVGYSMLLPVREEIYERIRSGHFVDTALTPDMVLSFDRPGIYRMYFASVVIHPEHRGASLILTLLDAMVDDFIALAERGIFGQSLTADVVSSDGEKFCRLFGLTNVCPTDHNSNIFEVSGLPPEFRITTPRTERLAGIYWERFVRQRLEAKGTEVDGAKA